ncbi:hypothetical protein [Paraburkholderia sp. BL25I1N1]|uniref:hypothetical protein n=1 Tax=Paraburkholderia sp. BL25I1N1 TaxID=1938804 RepID=UPI000D063944|nr:hypothetical protein [Paraburkholderia sp. BL25I1N1]PRY05601.1 hypothetical protein B0G73_109198 [Paraburkholderia sp. BL25I1N1]
MLRPARQTEETTALEDARVDYAIGRAVAAAILVDPAGVEALLDIPDAELGRLFKNRLWKIIGVATVYNLDLRAMREEDERLRKRSSHLSKVRASELEGKTQGALAARYALVQDGKLLREKDFCLAAHITVKKLGKDLTSGRIFSANAGRARYYPAFFLSHMIGRNDLARVIRRLRDTPGWSKWDFFTTATKELGGWTPLQLLKNGEVKTVLMAAAEFAKGHASQLPKS